MVRIMKFTSTHLDDYVYYSNSTKPVNEQWFLSLGHKQTSAHYLRHCYEYLRAPVANSKHFYKVEAFE